MQSTKENAVGLWRARKGLVVLLMAGALVALLAVLAPQAWATPDQNPLQQTIEVPCVGPIVGAVFEDVTGDGIYSVGDVGIPGVKVTLDPLTAGERITYTTDASHPYGPGFFKFEPVSEGSHVIQIEVPEGYTVVGPNPQTVIVPDWQPGDVGCAKAYFPLVRPVGGYVMPIMTLGSLVPYLGVGVLLATIFVGGVFWVHRRR